MMQTALNLVTRELVPEAHRMSVTGKYFGLHFPLQIEPTVYGITERMAEDSQLFPVSLGQIADVVASGAGRLFNNGWRVSVRQCRQWG